MARRGVPTLDGVRARGEADIRLFFSVFRFPDDCPIGTDGVAVGFCLEFTHEQKHAGRPSETKSHQETGFSGFSFSNQREREPVPVSRTVNSKP